MVVILNIHGQPVKPCDERGYRHRYSGGQVVDGIRTCRYCGIENELDVGRQLRETVFKTRPKKRKPKPKPAKRARPKNWRGPGRFMPANPELETQVTIRMSRVHRQLLEEIGAGSASEGLRRLLDEYGYQLARRSIAQQAGKDDDELVI